jgi:hypothetical protein
VAVKCNCKGQPSAVCVCNAPGIVGRSGNCRVSASVLREYGLCWLLIVVRHTLSSNGLILGRNLRTRPQSCA